MAAEPVAVEVPPLAIEVVKEMLVEAYPSLVGVLAD